QSSRLETSGSQALHITRVVCNVKPVGSSPWTAAAHYLRNSRTTARRSSSTRECAITDVATERGTSVTRCTLEPTSQPQVVDNTVTELRRERCPPLTVEDPLKLH